MIDLSKQLFVLSIGVFPENSPLQVSYSNYKHAEFYPWLGGAIVLVVEAVQRGGELIFISS